LFFSTVMFSLLTFILICKGCMIIIYNRSCVKCSPFEHRVVLSNQFHQCYFSVILLLFGGIDLLQMGRSLLTILEPGEEIVP
jgi:hypothetical protein